MRSTSHIALDLSQSNTLEALESLSNMSKTMSKIKSASVYTSRPGVGIHPMMGDTPGIERIFGMLANMPNLKEVKVDLNRPHHFTGNGDMTLRALTLLLRGAKNLQTLQLCQLDLRILASASSCSGSGGGDQQQQQQQQQQPQPHRDAGAAVVEEFSEVVAQLKHWRAFHVTNCTGRGMGLVMNLLAHRSNSLRVVRIVGTPLLATTLPLLTARPRQLHVLSIKDVPEVTDGQVALLALNLAHPACALKELEIRSSALTEAAGEALVDMLWMNQSIEKLYLHLDCESLGVSIANCFCSNTTLRQVDLRCYGDDEAVSRSTVQIANALRHNQTLQKMRLCLEIEPHEYQDDIVCAFQQALRPDHNTTLCELILDDGIQDYPLPPEIELALQLNRSGYASMVTSSQTNQVSMNQWVHALATRDIDTSTIYTILRGCPMLFSAAIHDDNDGCQPAVSIAVHDGILPTSPSTSSMDKSDTTKGSLLDDSSSSSTRLRFRLPFRSKSFESTDDKRRHRPCRSFDSLDETMPCRTTTTTITTAHSRFSPSAKSRASHKTKLPSLRRKMMSILAPSA